MAKVQSQGKAPSEEKKNIPGKAQKPLEQSLQPETPSLQNAVNSLDHPTPSGMHTLQRTIGNRAVQNLVENKQHGTSESTVIQRHVGSFAEPASMATDSLLNASAESMQQGLGAVVGAQGMFQSYRAMAASTPLPGSEESTSGPRGTVTMGPITITDGEGNPIN